MDPSQTIKLQALGKTMVGHGLPMVPPAPIAIPLTTNHEYIESTGTNIVDTVLKITKEGAPVFYRGTTVHYRVTAARYHAMAARYHATAARYHATVARYHATAMRYLAMATKYRGTLVLQLFHKRYQICLV